MKTRDMTLLVRIAETGSMTLAAKQLHVTPAAVSATVQRIEESLGVRLFERTTRTLHVTDEGGVIVEACQDILARWQRTLEDVRADHHELEGEVHFSAPADTTYNILQPVMAAMSARHNNLRIVMHTGDTVHHRYKDAIDMAIRYGPLQDSTLTARKLSDFPYILVASPSYLAEAGVPRDVHELHRHRQISIQLNSVPMSSWALISTYAGSFRWEA